LETAKSRNGPLAVRGSQDCPDHSRIRTETSGSECHQGVTRTRTRRKKMNNSRNTRLNEAVHECGGEELNWSAEFGVLVGAVTRRNFSGNGCKIGRWPSWSCFLILITILFYAKNRLRLYQMGNYIYCLMSSSMLNE